jgi:aspartate kinase
MNQKSNIIIQKYGGSSLANVKTIKIIASLIKYRFIKNKKICVIVSAMGKTTNKLINLANQINKKPPLRELDMLISCGERSSMSLLAMALNSINVPSISFTGSQSGIITDNKHSMAKIIAINPIRVQKELKKNKVVIIAGFQGISKKNEITTLGRGGSDITAVAMAAALKAKVCEIYSDVDGIYTADPNIITSANIFKKISYEQTYNIAKSGSRVLHYNAIKIAKQKGIEIHTKKVGSLNTGTIISNTISKKFFNITHRETVFKISLNNNSKFLIFLKHLQDNNINTILIRLIKNKSFPSFIFIDKENFTNLTKLLIKNQHQISTYSQISIILNKDKNINELLYNTITTLKKASMDIKEVTAINNYIYFFLKQNHATLSINILHKILANKTI